MTRTFVSLQRLEPGFDLTNIVTATASLEDTRYQTAAQIQLLFDRTLERVSSISGVESAAVSLGLPYQRILNLGFKPLDGEQAGDTETGFIANVTYVSPEYFSTLRIPLKKGRVIEPVDREESAGAVVVNEAFERRFYRDGAIGRRIGVAGREREIVGVVANVQQGASGIGGAGPIQTTPIVYLAAAQTMAGTFNLVHTWFSPTWIVRTSRSVTGIEQHLRAAVSAIDPQLPVASVRSMSQVRSAATESQRFLMVLATMLGAASMLLAAIGIHGLISSSITERTREIGIRMALGSTAAQAIRVIAWPGIALTVIGIVIGGLLARALTRYIASLLWGVQPTDPATFGLVGALLLFVAILASVLPALRIMRWDPAQTLRA
ncbi:MAG: FtsX-like permease family protein [Vicinamibacterales bacterium]